MAFALVQANAGTGTGSTVNSPYSSNVTAGNLLVHVFQIFSDTITISSVTDSQGNTWNLAAASPSVGLGERTYCYYAIAGSSGACTVTVVQSASSGHNFHRLEFSGNHGTLGSVLADAAADGDGVGSAASIALGAIGANCLLVGGVATAASPVTGTGFTQALNSANNWNEHSQYDLDSGSAGSPTVAWNSSSDRWTGVAAAFNPPGGGGGGSTQPPRSFHQFTMRRAA